MRLIDADKLKPDCLTKDGRLAISQSQIANAPTVKPMDNCNAVIFPPDTLICDGCDNQENCIVSGYPLEDIQGNTNKRNSPK